MTLTRRQFITTSAIAAGAVVMTPFGRAMAAPVAVPTAPVAGSIKTISGKALDAELARLRAEPYTAGDPLRGLKITKGKYTRTTSIVVPSGVYLDATSCTFVLTDTKDAYRSLLVIDGVTDVMVVGGTWDGYRSKVKAKIKISGKSRPTQHRHSIRIGNSQRVLLRGLVAQNAMGDGIYVGADLVSDRYHSQQVTVENVKCTKNYRGGLAIVACDGFLATGSRFYTNSGTSPEAGAIIEPHPNFVINDITFRKCTFDKNHSRGFLAVMHPTSADPGTITLDSCSFLNNGRSTKDQSTAGIALLRPRSVTITNCTSSGNQSGIYIAGVRTGDAPVVRGTVVVNGGTIKNNLRDGVLVYKAISSLQVNGVNITSNSKKKKSKYNGIRVQHGPAGSSVQIVGGAITKHSRGYGVLADKGVTNVALAADVKLSGNKKSYSAGVTYPA
jgi:hypothetical protein